MKKIFLTLILIIGLLAATQAQRRLSIYEVPNKTTEFGLTMPIGTVIYQVDSLKLYRLTTRFADSLTMADVFTSGNYSIVSSGLSSSESDPIFSSWDKSSDISIIESQISDFGTYAKLDDASFIDTVFLPVLKLDTNSRILFTIPSNNGHISGNVINSIQSGYTSSAYDLVYLGSGGKWLEVDADTASTCNGFLAMALEAKNDTEEMLVALPGSFIKNTSWSWTVGATLYAGETLGSVQEALPSGANAIIKVIGFAITADIIYFYPSQDQQSIVE